MIFHQVIPEIGVIIAGAPAGRAAILSLHHKVTGEGKKVYSMNLDAIVPFEDQELARIRPASFLMGLAVSPMQGDKHLRKGGRSRSWRLFLHYQDCTILSYEITRDVVGASKEHLDIA